ncbi:YesN/AraC family two-component response regulator [Paenibacillus rhizosphaerae]|uniref:YesN/AraC family two-component response regulator n=1 Tax=Paenibacillus rhizosphaerae TaxID=297318 RepID=A0A839TP86_9BACL|nr:response regulator [Paenibacillus rhizosphaerae]MBB3128512.1 YesN/AraC family two-component response regulator [Paenibacillus rhizosphaerae]
MLKLLLVDDESAVLQGLTHILTQYCPNYDIVGATQHAAEAMQLLMAEHVDCVITDVKMPDIDGVELTKHIRSHYPDTSVIVHSGYADFEFVRETMKHGACDYLLKPSNYRSILDILHQIEKRRTEESKQVEEIANQKLLRATLSGEKSASTAWSGPWPKRLATLTAMVRDTDHVTRLLKDRWKAGVLLKEMEELVAHDEHVIMLFPAGLNEDQLLSRLNSVRQLLQSHGYAAYIGIGCRVDAPDELRRSYEECLRRMDFASFNELPAALNGASYDAHMEKQKPHAFGDYFQIQELGKYLLKGDSGKLKQLSDAAVSELERLRLAWDPKRLKNDVLKETLLLNEYLREHGAHPAHPEWIDYADEVKRQLTFRDLMRWVKHISASLLLRSDGEEAVPGYIQTTVRYVEENYMEELTLKSLSDKVYLNPWYFSTQFKKWMNVSFSEYVNLVRVRMAKQLLRQKDLKVYEVAEMVGFKDAAYFSTVFKHLERMSPKDYQKTLS